MATYGKYTLTTAKMKFIRGEMARVCEGIDVELGLDCSGSMSKPAEPGQPSSRFEVGINVLSALAEPMMAGHR